VSEPTISTPRGGSAAALEGGRTASPADASGRRAFRPGRWLSGVVEFVYRLADSTLATPKVAVGVSLAGIVLVMLVGVFSPNYNTLPRVYNSQSYVAVVLPLSDHFGRLPDWTSIPLTFLAIILQCLGLAGLLWANSRGWKPNPRHLFLGACVIVAIMVNITPVGSSDTTSYAAYGRMANIGIDPYSNGPSQLGPSDQSAGPSLLGPGELYKLVVGPMWQHTPSVYGPLATFVQQVAAHFGGATNPAAAVSALMIFNGIVFLAVGLFLMRTADDPVRAALMWVANPVLIQQLVAGGHLDTYVAAATVVGIQLARRGGSGWRFLWVGVAIGAGCCFKINAALAGVAVGWVLLTRREWANLARLSAGGLGTVAGLYSFYGWHAVKQLSNASSLVATPSPWRLFQLLIEGVFDLFGAGSAGKTVSTDLISVAWPLLLVAVAYLIYRQFGPDQSPMVTVPFAVTFAWVIVAPWGLPWYAAVSWVILALVPRNPMTRWLTLVTVYLALMHCSGGGPAPWAN
jgi:hypothetical protein